MKTMKESKVTNDSILEIGRSVDPAAWFGHHPDDDDWCLRFARLVLKQQKQEIINMLEDLGIEGSGGYGELCAAAVKEIE